MKTFKGQTVPEGATHYSEASLLHPFYKYTDDYFGCYCNVTDRWVQLVYSWADDYSLVGLPNSSERDVFVAKSIKLVTDLVLRDFIDIKHLSVLPILIDELANNGARFTEDE